MRLWHYKLIPFLPDQQLRGQWSELNWIFKDQPKYILINYVYEYDKANLLIYTNLILEEMSKRKFKINSFENSNNYFGHMYVNIPRGGIHTINPFPNHHTNSYLLQCFYNLQEKYYRGQKDFSKELYEKLEEFMKNEIH